MCRKDIDPKYPSFADKRYSSLPFSQLAMTALEEVREREYKDFSLLIPNYTAKPLGAFFLCENLGKKERKNR